MWDFNLLAATRSIEASKPFLLYRLMVYLGVGLAFLLSALAGAGTAIAFASFSTNPSALASLGAILGFAGCGFFLYKQRAGLFFNVKAGHLALLAEQSRGGKIPESKAQVDYAKQAAAQRFASPSDFLEVSQSIVQAMKALPQKYWRALHGVKNETIAKILDLIAGRIAASCDQAILALHFLRDGDNPWKSAQTGLILQARHFSWLLKNRLYSLLFEYIGLLAAFALILVPVSRAAALLPIGMGVWRFVIAFILAWSLKAAFFQPIATAAMASLYFKLAEKEASESEGEIEELSRYSDAFRKIREKAA